MSTRTEKRTCHEILQGSRILNADFPINMSHSRVKYCSNLHINTIEATASSEYFVNFGIFDHLFLFTFAFVDSRLQLASSLPSLPGRSIRETFKTDCCEYIYEAAIGAECAMMCRRAPIRSPTMIPRLPAKNLEAFQTSLMALEGASESVGELTSIADRHHPP